MPGRRPEWKAPRLQVNIKLSPEARRTLRALARRRKLLAEYIETLIREEHGKG